MNPERVLFAAVCTALVAREMANVAKTHGMALEYQLADYAGMNRIRRRLLKPGIDIPVVSSTCVL
jgi:hypothetical protein